MCEWHGWLVLPVVCYDIMISVNIATFCWLTVTTSYFQGDRQGLKQEIPSEVSHFSHLHHLNWPKEYLSISLRISILWMCSNVGGGGWWGGTCVTFTPGHWLHTTHLLESYLTPVLDTGYKWLQTASSQSSQSRVCQPPSPYQMILKI